MAGEEANRKQPRPEQNKTNVSTCFFGKLLFHRPLPLALLAALIVCTASLLGGCVSPTPTATRYPVPLAATGAALPTFTPGRTPSPFPPSSVSPSPTLFSSPLPSTSTSPPVVPRLVVLAQDLDTPDDLVLAPDHSVYFTDVGNGTVDRLDANGHTTRIISNLQAPEGIVFLPDSSLVVTEQGKNRLVRFDPGANRLTTFLQLENKTGHDGVDGILLDPKTLTIIVPDSPNGTLLRVGLDGKKVQVIARGIARPTGADLEPDGRIVVVDEDGSALLRVPSGGGSPQLLARLPVPDDVVVDGDGRIYVSTLGDGAIHLIDAETGKDKVLWRGLNSPQGIILDAQGNLVIADPGNHRIIRLIIK